MTKINVICGGASSEREISLRSGKAVALALQKYGYEVTVLDSYDHDEYMKDCTIAFPVLHGVGGEDGEFQSRLEALDIPYIGSDSTSSKLCMDKSAYRKFMKQHGILMPMGESVNEKMYFAHELTAKPHVLKPIDGGSSVDTHIIRHLGDQNDALIRQSFQRHPYMLLEELIVGVEVTVGVLGDEALPVIEIIPPKDGDFDFANKYNGKTQELTPPPHVSDEIQIKVQQLALAVHQTAGCRDFSRSDFIISPEGSCYLLETNTIPGLTDQSLFPKAALAAGYSMQDLVKTLVGFALARK